MMTQSNMVPATARVVNRVVNRAVNRVAARVIPGVIVRGTLLIALAGCKDLVGNPALPPGTQDPNLYNTPAGALQFAQGATDLLRQEIVSYVITSGLLSDELTHRTNASNAADSIDARILPEEVGTSQGISNRTIFDYNALQKLRGQASLARGVVGKYAPNAASTVIGKLYAIEGYTDLLIADLYCSGVPLSTIDFEKDYTYQPGSTTVEIYERAVQLFDSALVHLGDSTNLLTFARVGKGRALLNLARYAEAAQAVAEVPDGSSHTLRISMSEYAAESLNHFASAATVANAEGGNGLPYLTGGDLRSIADPVSISFGGSVVDTYYPRKYITSETGQPVIDSTTFVVADWIEARLIEAEAALQGNNVETWKDKLDHLRATAPANGVTGALPPVTDPGTAVLRIDTMFAERAHWLFVTGHRQGDLRRLVRNYHRPQNQVYPTGPFVTFPTYGASVNAPVPAGERINPHFRRCFNRDA